jgi:hypothetical protein
MSGLHRGCFVAAGAAVIASIVVLSYLPARDEKVDDVLVNA